MPKSKKTKRKIQKLPARRPALKIEPSWFTTCFSILVLNDELCRFLCPKEKSCLVLTCRLFAQTARKTSVGVKRLGYHINPDREPTLRMSSLGIVRPLDICLRVRSRLPKHIRVDTTKLCSSFMTFPHNLHSYSTLSHLRLSSVYLTQTHAGVLFSLRLITMEFYLVDFKECVNLSTLEGPLITTLQVFSYYLPHSFRWDFLSRFISMGELRVSQANVDEWDSVEPKDVGKLLPSLEKLCVYEWSSDRSPRAVYTFSRSNI